MPSGCHSWKIRWHLNEVICQVSSRFVCTDPLPYFTAIEGPLEVTVSLNVQSVWVLRRKHGLGFSFAALEAGEMNAKRGCRTILPPTFIAANFWCSSWLLTVIDVHSQEIQWFPLWHSEVRASWCILIIKPTRCANLSNLIWNRTLHVSVRFSVHHQESSTVYTAIGIYHTGFADCLIAWSGSH